MGCTVKELLERTSSCELSEWMAYYSIEPFGEGRADWRQGITSMILAQANSKKGKTWKVEDFMLKDKKKSSQMSQEEITKVLNLLS